MEELVADKIAKDPKIKATKNTLLRLFDKYSKSITHVSLPQSKRKKKYEKLIEEINTYRGFPLWYSFLGSGAGNGALVELEDGSVKYDFISGIGVHLGHSHPRIVEAVLTASLQNCAMQTSLQQNRDSVQLMKLLTTLSGIPHCFLTTSGAMACENAFKVIFQKKFPAQRILTFDRCFTGRTLALSQITDKPQYREGLPMNIHVDYVPFYDEKNPVVSTEKAVRVLKKYLSRYPNQHACMAFELIQGEAGYYPGSHTFFVTLMKILKEKNIAIFIDEIQTFARTDSLFAFQHFKLKPYVNVLTVGKLLHTCATLYTEDYKPKPGLIAQTYLSSTAAIHASLAVVKEISQKGKYFGKNGKNNLIHHHFVMKLKKLSKKYPDKVSGPFGYGLMIAFTPYDGSQEKAIQLARSLFDAGLMAFIGGTNPTRIRFHVPIGSVKLTDIDGAIEILDQTLAKLW